MMRYEIIQTSWGPFVVLATERGIVGTYLPERGRRSARELVRRRHPDAKPGRNLASGLGRAVKAFFAGQPVAFDADLDLSGFTPFQEAVLLAARRIPYGETATYGDLARAAGASKAARAVGSVMAGNPLPLIVPCHRVVRSDGTIGGFSAPDGVSMKRRLLALEGNADVFQEDARRAG